MQALAPDILEAIARVETMTPDEIEETIDYLLNEVFSSFVAASFSLMFLIERSTGKIPLVVI